MASPQAQSTLKIFLDASVIFSAVLSTTGAGRELITNRSLNRTLLASAYVLEETKRNLTLKAPKALPYFELLEQYPPFVLVTPPTKTEIARIATIVDAKDAPVVAGALRGRADYLVSYDKPDLLDQAAMIEESFGLKVVAPAEVLRLLRQVSGN